MSRLLAAGGAVAALTLTAGAEVKSGLQHAHFDLSIRPQDDLYRYVNGGWMARAAMPSERVAHGTFTELADRAELDVRAIIEAVRRTPGPAPGSPEQQIADLYASIMDEARLEALGAAPIAPELARIDAMSSTHDVATRAGHLSAHSWGGPFAASAAGDATNPGQVIVTVQQGGILLPDREYYLSAGAHYADVRQRYRQYLVRVFTLGGRQDPQGDADAVMRLETALADAHVPRGAAGEAPARRSLRALMREMAGFDWTAWAAAQGIDSRSDVILAQPSFFRRFAALVPETPMAAWRAWLAARHITAAAPFLSRAFAEARFAFFGRLLSGQEAPIVQWKRGVSLVNGYLGDAVGRLYVERHFSAAARARMRELVATLLRASRDAVAEADWMTPSARSAALEKLRDIRTRIGYPDRWRRYDGLVIKADDLVGNILRAQRFDNAYRMALLRRTDAHEEWLVPPQTVNAFYRPGLNEVVVPAAILQPPVFQLDADPAVNYGAIGAVVGHEIVHAIDERGRGFDSTGAPRDWWTADDARTFQQRAGALVHQFNGFRSADGQPVNGSLTLGENVGDLGGLAIAHRACRLSLKGKPAPVIDGFTGDQRFFIGWAQAWRSIARDEYLRQWLTSIPHAPPEFRANGPVANLDAFHAAFDVRPGDRLFVEPARRVRLW